MRKSRFSEHQIIGNIERADAGRKVQDICREYGISSATYHKWKSKFGGWKRPIFDGSVTLKQSYPATNKCKPPSWLMKIMQLKDVIAKKL